MVCSKKDGSKLERRPSNHQEVVFFVNEFRFWRIEDGEKNGKYRGAGARRVGGGASGVACDPLRSYFRVFNSHNAGIVLKNRATSNDLPNVYFHLRNGTATMTRSLQTKTPSKPLPTRKLQARASRKQWSSATVKSAYELNG